MAARNWALGGILFVVISIATYKYLAHQDAPVLRDNVHMWKSRNFGSEVKLYSRSGSVLTATLKDGSAYKVSVNSCEKVFNSGQTIGVLCSEGGVLWVGVDATVYFRTKSGNPTRLARLPRQSRISKISKQGDVYLVSFFDPLSQNPDLLFINEKSRQILSLSMDSFWSDVSYAESLTEDGDRWIVASPGDQHIEVVSASRGRIKSIDVEQGIRCLGCFHGVVFTGSNDGSVRLVDLVKGKPAQKWDCVYPINKLAVSTAGALVGPSAGTLLGSKGRIDLVSPKCTISKWSIDLGASVSEVQYVHNLHQFWVLLVDGRVISGSLSGTEVPKALLVDRPPIKAFGLMVDEKFITVFNGDSVAWREP